MKNYYSFTFGIMLIILSQAGCDKKSDNLLCNQITINKPFIAKVDEQWCLDDWKIRFGPIQEDSRCNVVDVECVWAGRFVMAAEIDNGESVQDTFYAVSEWRDTLYNGPYKVILNKVFPEVRTSTDPLDDSAYSFEIIVKE